MHFEDGGVACLILDDIGLLTMVMYGYRVNNASIYNSTKCFDFETVLR